MNEIVRIWPPAEQTPLDDDALIEAYSMTAANGLRVNFVTSLDGAVELDGYSAGLSGPPDKRVFGLLRMLCDGLIVGAGTVRREGYDALTLDARRRDWRTRHGLPPYPTMIVVSRRLDLDPAWGVFTGAPVRPIVVTAAAAPAVNQAALAEVADLIIAGEQRVDLAAAVDMLRARGLRHLLSEGGPVLFGGLTAADLVDELCLTVSPLLTGAGAGRIIAGPTSAPRSLSLRHALAADGMLLLRYARRPDSGPGQTVSG